MPSRFEASQAMVPAGDFFRRRFQCLLIDAADTGLDADRGIGAGPLLAGGMWPGVRCVSSVFGSLEILCGNAF